MRRRTPEERYRDNIRQQRKTLEKFVAHETEWANDLMLWYRAKKLEMPEDEYRGVSYFLNYEHKNKPGSLTLLYSMYLRFHEELPPVTKENAFDLLRFQFKMYAVVLKQGGYGG
jgi:hypothetical protein